MDEGLAQNQPGHSKNLHNKLMALPVGHSIPPAEEDLAMLSYMVSEAYQGVDIASRYPTFYEKLETNGKLRAYFLDALDLMEHTKAGTLAPLPGPPSRDLSFLQKARSKPIIEQNSWQEWRVTWQRTVKQLQHFFPSPELVYRGEDDWSEDVWIPLLRDEVQLNDLTLHVVLEANEGDDAVYLPSLRVVPVSDESNLPFIQATLQWGDYQEKVTVDARGRAAFPPLPLTTIYDPVLNLYTADLQLSLESVATPTS